MFTPGHLHRTNTPAIPGVPEYNIDVFYEVRRDPKEGMLMHFKMVGDVSGHSFTEEFDMHRDTAFNFASRVAKAAVKHGVPANASLIMRGHKEYDAMFEDIRDKLGVQPGDPVNLDNAENDRR
ncbi:DUF5064 domain-containing protein [Pseudomonas laurylsulfativorans]|uniref:DUF5064 domain-containing protein n=1 Tax=Pseudomonas laurylsulfativorans TaxID=1943631 RepID=A0A2S3VGN3_9PSED|nr:DUF5064 family protein [Pseudomonas laurylsulfativorans]POF39124.1 DUF5064 domain-containing protein [Pseudomonas laurylsulfativorans]